MHISEGILPMWTLIGGAGLSALPLYMGFKALNERNMAKTALFASAFFVASLIHIPIGPTSSHLILNGLLGIVLGPRAAPAIFIALLLQAIIFQFGGITTLGVNTFNMTLPALVCYWITRPFINNFMTKYPVRTAIICGIASCFTVLLSATLTALSLLFANKEGFWLTSKMLIISHVPVAIIEGIITAFIIKGLIKIKKEVLL